MATQGAAAEQNKGKRQCIEAKTACERLFFRNTDSADLEIDGLNSMVMRIHQRKVWRSGIVESWRR